MKILLTILFAMLLHSAGWAQSAHQLVLDYFLENHANEETYKRQCSCPHQFDSTYKILIVDSSDFNPILDHFAPYLNVDGAEISNYDYSDFVKKHIELDTLNQEYKIIHKAPKRLSNKHLIRMSSLFRNEGVGIIEIWIKDTIRCPGIIFSYLIDMDNFKVLHHKKIRVCDNEG